MNYFLVKVGENGHPHSLWSDMEGAESVKEVYGDSAEIVKVCQSDKIVNYMKLDPDFAYDLYYVCSLSSDNPDDVYYNTIIVEDANDLPSVYGVSYVVEDDGVEYEVEEGSCILDDVFEELPFDCDCFLEDSLYFINGIVDKMGDYFELSILGSGMTKKDAHENAMFLYQEFENKIYEILNNEDYQYILDRFDNFNKELKEKAELKQKLLRAKIEEAKALLKEHGEL